MERFQIDSLAQMCQEETQLFNIMFVLLSACNHNCVHCYIPEHTNMGLPTDKVKALIDEARALGALNVTFTGGEILLRKDLLELVAYARSQYMRVFLMSNAYALTEDSIKKLSDLCISEFSTTVFAMDPAIHDRITQVPGSLNRVLHNIDLLKKHGIRVTIKTPLMEINKFCYREVEKYASDNGFHFMNTATIFSKTNGDRSPHDLEIGADLRQVVYETDILNKKYRGERIVLQDGEIPCSAGHSNICINYDGTVWPCNTLTLDVGNVFSASLRDIWIGSSALNHWRKSSRKIPAVCTQCKMREQCVRCPGLAYMENGDLFGCSLSAKRIAEQRTIEIRGKEDLV